MLAAASGVRVPNLAWSVESVPCATSVPAYLSAAAADKLAASVSVPPVSVPLPPPPDGSPPHLPKWNGYREANLYFCNKQA